MSHPHNSVESSVAQSTAVQAGPVVAEFSLPAIGFALAEFFERVPSARVECKPTIANPDDHALLLIETEGCTEAAKRALEADPDVEALEHFGSASDHWRCRVTWQDQPRQLIQDIVKRNISILSLFGENGQWKIRLEAANRTNITSVDTLMEQLDREVECLRISSHYDEAERDPNRLTFEQREALTEAAKAGYYEIPRSATSEEVADRFGISHQALSERLRRAHSHLVNAHLRIDDTTTQ